MKNTMTTLAARASCALAAFLGLSQPGLAQSQIIWEAFNDHRPTDGVTSPNASTFDLRAADDGGVLRNILTGEDVEASVLVAVEGDGIPDDFGANSPVNADSPADKLFKGKVDIGNAGLPGIRNSVNTKLILNFNGLDPSKRYKFRGTVSRGGNYNDRWSVFTISGADASVAAHEDGSANQNIFTKATFAASDLGPNQVALNSGDNKAGSLVGWDNIEPGADGTFAIEAQQYVGVAPFGNPSAAAYAYGFNAIYVAKIESTGNLRVTENPANRDVPAGQTATFTVAGTSPSAITYQWQKAPPGSSTFADIAGATQASYTTPVLAVADHGSKFRCILSSGANKATSGEATLGVDGIIPSVSGIRGSINLNSIYVSFSEPMKLSMLANKDNYTLSGGLTVSSAIALDPQTARLLTSSQTGNTRYTIGVKDVEDVAGNKVPSGSSGSFSGYSVQTGVAGLEVWNSIGGGTAQDLRNDARYPASPDVDYTAASFDSTLIIPDGPNNTYGGRFRAWLTPEETGEYEFFLRCDDGGEFRISADDKFDTLDSIDIEATAVDSSSGDPFQEPGFDLSTSIPISLVKGTRYAIQMIWKEGNGNDHGQVAWRKVGDATPADQLTPIPSRFLSYYGAPPAPGEEPTIIRSGLEGGQFVIEWKGGILQSSTDLAAFTDETGATSPLRVTPNANRFYRVKKP
jgi:PA14 domain